MNPASPTQTVKPALSIIVSTYNSPKALTICLASLSEQTDRDFEIIVADDGSDERTAAVIEAARQARPTIPIRHVRQEDKGFRLARIRNLAVLDSRGDYVVFIDGDCFVLADFVANHRLLAQTGAFVSGKRSYLRRRITARTLAAGAPPPGGRWRWLGRALLNNCTRPAEFILLPDGAWRFRAATEWQRAQACNLGVWRADLDAVNGFDNRYVGHGLEDSDFIVRLLRSGIRRKLGDRACVVLHLEHERRSGPRGSPNGPLLSAALTSSDYRSVDGIDELRQPWLTAADN